MTSHLVKRAGRYSIRRKIPVDLQASYGRVEIVKALGTSDPVRAQELCRIEGVRFDQEFAAARQALKAPESVYDPLYGKWITPQQKLKY